MIANTESIATKPRKRKAKPAKEQSPILVGRGVLTWQRFERHSGRYGSVWLMQDGTEAQAVLWFPHTGQTGTLKARVLDARKSPHIGDLARGIYPKTPTVGQEETLGSGFGYAETENGITSFVVEPKQDRARDWMSPRALYNLHNSLVELHWHPD